MPPRSRSPGATGGAAQGAADSQALRDAWPVVHARLRANHRIRTRRFATGGLAIAAGIALLLLVRGATSSSSLNASTALSEAMTRSGQLEQLLESYNADGRITDGHTDGMAGALEDQIARIDRQLEMAQLLRARERDTALLNLYRERIGLLDALMDVHVTRASNVGL